MRRQLENTYQRVVCAMCGADEMTATGIVRQSDADGAWTRLCGTTADVLVCGACGQENDGIHVTAQSIDDKAAPSWAEVVVDASVMADLSQLCAALFIPVAIGAAVVRSGILHAAPIPDAAVDICTMVASTCVSAGAVILATEVIGARRNGDDPSPVELPVGRIAYTAYRALSRLLPPRTSVKQGDSAR